MSKKTLTQIINDDKTEAAAKLPAISRIVSKARKAYGNSDVEIDIPEINTCEGKTGLQYLTAEDKVAVAANEISAIRVCAIEATKATDGAVLDREIERLLAVNPVLVNLETESGSDYI